LWDIYASVNTDNRTYDVITSRNDHTLSLT